MPACSLSWADAGHRKGCQSSLQHAQRHYTVSHDSTMVKVMMTLGGPQIWLCPTSCAEALQTCRTESYTREAWMPEAAHFSVDWSTMAVPGSRERTQPKSVSLSMSGADIRMLSGLTSR